MTKSRTMPRLFLLIVAAMVLLAVLALLVVNRAEFSRRELPVYGVVPDFRFVDQEGQPFGREDMLGRVNLVYFGFTRCKGPCPIIARVMKELHELYQGSELIQFVMVSVDPKHDSVPVLKAYADSLGADYQTWKFIRAPMDSVVWMCEDGFMLPAEGLPGNHTTKISVVDHEGRIRSYHDALNDTHIDIMKRRVRELARSMP